MFSAVQRTHVINILDIIYQSMIIVYMYGLVRDVGTLYSIWYILKYTARNKQNMKPVQ